MTRMPGRAAERLVRSFGNRDRARRRALAVGLRKVPVLDEQRLVLAISQPRALTDEFMASSVTESTSLCLRRWPARRFEVAA